MPIRNRSTFGYRTRTLMLGVEEARSGGYAPVMRVVWIQKEQFFVTAHCQVVGAA